MRKSNAARRGGLLRQLARTLGRLGRRRSESRWIRSWRRSESRQDELALWLPRDATALPGRRRRKVRAVRHMYGRQRGWQADVESRSGSGGSRSRVRSTARRAPSVSAGRGGRSRRAEVTARARPAGSRSGSSTGSSSSAQSAVHTWAARRAPSASGGRGGWSRRAGGTARARLAAIAMHSRCSVFEGSKLPPVTCKSLSMFSLLG